MFMDIYILKLLSTMCDKSHFTKKDVEMARLYWLIDLLHQIESLQQTLLKYDWFPSVSVNILELVYWDIRLWWSDDR